MILSEKIKELRLEREMTQEELADRIGVARWSVTQYENGNRIPRKSTVKKIAAVFGISPEILSNDESELHTDDEIIERYGVSIKEKYGEEARIGFRKMVLNNKPMFAGGLMPEKDRDKFIAAIAETYLRYCELSIEKYGKIMQDEDTGE